MARQKGILKLQGTIGEITFYKSGGEYLAREKGGIDADRIANDPAFERTRENGVEFGRAGSGGKLLRNSIRVLLLNASDSRMVGRLTRDLVRVIKQDEVNPRGQRILTAGDLTALQGFEFNLKGKLSTSVYIPYTVNIDRVLGEVELSIPGFVPGTGIAAPTGATHMKFVAGSAAVDFEGNDYASDLASSDELIIGSQNEDPITLTMAVPENSAWPLFAVFGVEFFQEVNSVLYPLKNGAFNALAIVRVDVQ